jgi:hypothetical protein
MLARLFSKLIGRDDREAGPRDDREAAPQVRIVITGGERIDPQQLAASVSRISDFHRAGLGTFL